jgi:hypothetical protein
LPVGADAINRLPLHLLDVGGIHRLEHVSHYGDVILGVDNGAQADKYKQFQSAV